MSYIPYTSIKLLQTENYERWYSAQTSKIKGQIIARLSRIELEGYFGNCRRLSSDLWELKFNNGNRIYYTLIEHKDLILILILGGNKNGQDKDIFQANKLAKEFAKKNWRSSKA